MMASVHQKHCADDFCVLAKTRSRPNGALPLPLNLLTIAVVVFAVGLAGCAREPVPRELNPAQRQVRAIPVRSPSRSRVYVQTRQHAELREHAELRVHRPDPALLTPQPAPNCEFNRADINAVDPDEWARLKTAFERQCYQDAEKAARDRLSQLQASSTCEIERVPQKAPAQ